MTMLKKMRENKKKGFTLVELIVVLVILAILAALLIPALTGYIDKARRKSVVAETRQAVMAAQTIADEEYVKKSDYKFGADGTDATEIKKVTDLAELKDGSIDKITVESGKVTELTYHNDTKTCTYTKGKTDGTDGAYDVADVSGN